MQTGYTVVNMQTLSQQTTKDTGKDVVSKEIAFGFLLQILDLRCVIPLSIGTAEWGTCVMSQYINPRSQLPCVSAAILCPPADVL